jgi:magnesium-transporting ATPase (P-type)
MSEKNTSSQQVQHKINIPGQANGFPPLKRRRKKKKKYNIKKYLEWLIWAIVIAFFLITIAMLFTEAFKKDDSIKKKASIENYNFIVLT